MSGSAERGRIIQDEADAEKRYLAHLEQAQIQARNLASDVRHTEAKRAAAAEVEAALGRVEEARRKAESAPDPAAVKHTFWDWLRGA
jgi:hypothetical protein